MVRPLNWFTILINETNTKITHTRTIDYSTTNNILTLIKCKAF